MSKHQTLEKAMWWQGPHKYVWFKKSLHFFVFWVLLMQIYGKRIGYRIKCRFSYIWCGWIAFLSLSLFDCLFKFLLSTFSFKWEIVEEEKKRIFRICIYDVRRRSSLPFIRVSAHAFVTRQHLTLNFFATCLLVDGGAFHNGMITAPKLNTKSNLDVLVLKIGRCIPAGSCTVAAFA